MRKHKRMPSNRKSARGPPMGEQEHLDDLTAQIWPDDVIQEILVRLPVKTLLRFKCVCKQWCALIGSPSFINQHYGHKNNQECLLVEHRRPTLIALYVDETLSRYKKTDHLQMPNEFFDLMGPLNGIYCVHSVSKRMALLNLAMRQFKPLPLLCPNVHPDLSEFWEVIGFGLDLLNGGYKVVSIKYFVRDPCDRHHCCSFVSVYDSSSDQWRSLDDVGLAYSHPRAYKSLCNTYLNGVYYWLLPCIGIYNVAVLAFDMNTEKFHKVRVPGCVFVSDRGLLALCGDSLALVTCNSCMTDKCVEVWIMKNEGCWIRRSKIGPFSGISRPLGFWKNDELLLERGTSLALYNVCTKKRTSLALYNVCTQKLRTFKARNDGSIVRALFYEESLISIKGEGDECKLWDTNSDFVKDFFRNKKQRESYLRRIEN